MDLQVENHGSIFLLRPVSDTGREWINDHLLTPEGEAPQMFGDATVVEHRYIGEIVEGAIEDGLVVA